MKARGTPGFVPDRLVQAREARQMTGVALAELVNVTSASITQYEKGRTTPSPQVLHRLAMILNVQPAFFTTPPLDDEGASAIFWRSTSSATVASRRRAKSRYEWLLEIVAYLKGLLDLPPVNFPNPVVSADPTPLTNEDIEIRAADAREFWGASDGPITDLTLLLENNGAIISQGELVAATLDAFSQWRWESNVPYVFLGTDKGSAARHRYNVAHELGHLLLHRYVPQVRIGRMEHHKLIEAQANRFAGAFLLPEERFRDELYAPTLDAMLALKAQNNVSVGMMIYRVSDLGMASDDYVTRLWMNYSRRGWRLKEPLDDEVPVEKPRLLKRAVEVLVGSGIQTKAQIRDRLPISPRDIEELTGLERGYLGDDLYPIRLAANGRAEDATREPPRSEGTKVLSLDQYRTKKR